MIPVFLISVAFAIARLLIVPDDSVAFSVFKDFAHLWVGGLFGGAILCRCLLREYTLRPPLSDIVRRTSRKLLAVAFALSILELVVGLWQHFHK